jgi:hypothetical protein
MLINYQALIDKAMHLVLKGALEQVANYQEKLDDESSFFISFLTHYPGVILSKHLKNKYPDEMMIVIQYQYTNLRVQEDKFSITLHFGGVPESITIPYNAIINYIDKKANFALSFEVNKIDTYTIETKISPDPALEKSNVIFLDNFRK